MVLIWVIFIIFILLMLALDLGVFHKKAHIINIREAFIWSGIWVAITLLFSIFVYFAYEGQWFGLGSITDTVDGLKNDGSIAVEKFLTGYVIEKSLSVDNIFIIALIFGSFAVPQIYQHRVLFWGILGALVLRGIMIGIGALVIAKYHWVLYVFAAFLILTALKMLFLRSENSDPNENIIVKLTRKFFPVTAKLHGEHFIVRAGSPESQESAYPGAPKVNDEIVSKAKAGTILLTPLALALIMVETTDLIFAVDSIPAIFAITGDPFLVFTSNVFAILGLRSLYFVLAGMSAKFQYLKVSLAIVLLVVGLKMIFAEWLKLTIGKHFNLYLLALVFLILTLGVIASIFKEKNQLKVQTE